MVSLKFLCGFFVACLGFLYVEVQEKHWFGLIKCLVMISLLFSLRLQIQIVELLEIGKLKKYENDKKQSLQLFGTTDHASQS